MLRILPVALSLSMLASSCCDPQTNGQPAATTEVSPSATGGFLSGSLITLRNSEGRYASVDHQVEGDARNVLIAKRDTADTSTEFRLELQGDGRIALRTASGRYVCGDRDKDGLLLADRDYVGDWETFELVPSNDGKYSLKTSNGKYVTADLEAAEPLRGRLIANRDQVGDWEKFTIEAVTLP